MYFGRDEDITTSCNRTQTFLVHDLHRAFKIERNERSFSVRTPTESRSRDVERIYTLKTYQITCCIIWTPNELLYIFEFFWARKEHALHVGRILCVALIYEAVNFPRSELLGIKWPTMGEKNNLQIFWKLTVQMTNFSME